MTITKRQNIEPRFCSWRGAGPIVAFLFLCAGLADANPVKMATDARMDVEASASVGSLSAGSAALGDGYLYRMDWLPVAAQARTYVGEWGIQHYGWTEIGLGFLPASNGTVTVDILGPWEMSPSGTIYRQEVAWDALTVSGAILTNGSFEALSGDMPVGWSNPWSADVVVTNDPPPVDGSNVVRVWHDRRLRVTLAVAGGQRVEWRAWVRAVVPAGFVDNPRISDQQSAAHRAARRFMRGVNFSNFFEAPAGEDWGGGPLGVADFSAVRSEGFDHVRLPVSWNYHTGPAPGYPISNAFFARVDAVVTGLLSRGVNVLLNVHHFDEFYANPASWTNKLYAIWDQLATHYAGYGEELAFEILNEPHDQATTAIMNGVYAHIIPRIRALNPDRTIFIGPGQWNGIDQLSGLRLPPGDSNIVVTVHSYAPFYFTHQGAEWTGSSTATTNVAYPGPPAAYLPPSPLATGDADVVEWFAQYNSLATLENPCSSNAFKGAFRRAHDWSVYYGRPVHVGEFGAYGKADDASRARYYRENREIMDREGLGWAIWDWKSGFHYWDRNAGRASPGMKPALFPQPALALDSTLSIHAVGAIGKRWIVQQMVNGNSSWTSLFTQELDSATFTYPVSATNPAAWFRVAWDY